MTGGTTACKSSHRWNHRTGEVVTATTLFEDTSQTAHRALRTLYSRPKTSTGPTPIELVTMFLNGVHTGKHDVDVFVDHIFNTLNMRIKELTKIINAEAFCLTPLQLSVSSREAAAAISSKESSANFRALS